MLIAILGINIGLIAWFRKESVFALISSIDKEIKDFHGRMCRLEEKYQQFRMEKQGWNELDYY